MCSNACPAAIRSELEPPPYLHPPWGNKQQTCRYSKRSYNSVVELACHTSALLLSTMATYKITVGILSIGQMGFGIAQLLLAHGFHVATNVSDRSSATKDRATSASIECVSSDAELVAKVDCTQGPAIESQQIDFSSRSLARHKIISTREISESRSLRAPRDK